METTIATPQPKIKYKTFIYRTGLSWTEKKQGVLTSDGKPSVSVSSPPEFKGYRFTKIHVRPSIIVRTPEAIEQVESAMHDAHASCLIANSISSQVTVEPTITVLSNGGKTP